MVHGMSVTDAAQRSDARKERDGKTAVHHPVVQEDVRQPEHRHADARPDGRRRCKSVQIAPYHHERGSDGRVGGGEHVVSLEPSAPPGVMAAMNAPERVMPDASVEDASPRLHRRGDHQRDDRADDHVSHGAHEGTS
ncbi:MAG: hypothetical protein NVS3B10_13960 [Polyangiales bacterium]